MIKTGLIGIGAWGKNLSKKIVLGVPAKLWRDVLPEQLLENQ